MSRKGLKRVEKSLFKDVENDDEDEQEDNSDDEEYSTSWTKEETQMLINAIKVQLKDNDTFSYVRRMQMLNWDLLRIEGKQKVDCKNRLKFLIRKIRHVRTLGEILGDVDIATIDIKKPKSAYAVFCETLKSTDMNGKNFFKEASAKFKKLSPEEKAMYEKESLKQSKEYKRVCPNGIRRKTVSVITPFSLFSQYKAQKDEIDKVIVKRQYMTLDDEEKLVWIKRALAENENVAEDKILNKEEQSILKGEPRPPLNAFNLFVKKFITSNDANFQSAAQAYRSLSKEDKQIYVDMAREAKVKYELAKTKFLFSLSPREREEYLKNINASKTVKTKSEKQDAKTSKSSDDEADEQVESDEDSYDSASNRLDISNIKKEKSFGQPSGSSTLLSKSSRKNASEEGSRTSRGDEGAGKRSRKAGPPPKRKRRRRNVDDDDDDDDDEEEEEDEDEEDDYDSDENNEYDSDKFDHRSIKVEKNRLSNEKENRTSKRARMDPPKRIPEVLYYYYKENVYNGKSNKAKKTYIRMDPLDKKNLKKEHQRELKRYFAKLKTYCISLNEKEMKDLQQRACEIELDERNESSDPDAD